MTHIIEPSQLNSGSSARVITFGAGLAAIPERLLIEHSRGNVLFIVGAGISMHSELPNFRDLTLGVYKEIDVAVHSVLKKIPDVQYSDWSPKVAGLTNPQIAEVKRFIKGDYDVALGMLERRMDDKRRTKSAVRKAVIKIINSSAVKPKPIHRALMQLADRGGIKTIITTNFDFLLEDSIRNQRPKINSFSLGEIPRPGKSNSFCGVLHIHGAINRHVPSLSDIVLTDEDFGEIYLRRRIVPDLIFDAARLFNLVLVGYSAEDAPMRYLLNAVSADNVRFGDLKERFAIFSLDTSNPALEADWLGRGITPITYDPSHDHIALSKTLQKWADLSNSSGKSDVINREVKRIVKQCRSECGDYDRDLFDHLIRRGSHNDIVQLSRLVSKYKVDIEWLDAIVNIASEKAWEHS